MTHRLIRQRRMLTIILLAITFPVFGQNSNPANSDWQTKVSPLLLNPFRVASDLNNTNATGDATQTAVHGTKMADDNLLKLDGSQGGGRRDTRNLQRYRRPAEDPNTVRMALKTIGGDRYVTAFVQVDPGMDVRSLPGFSLRRLSPDGSIAMGRLRLEDLPELAQNSRVRQVQPAMVRQALHRTSRGMIGADRVHDGIQLPQGFRGENVIMGVIDSGIDFSHDDFSRANGTRLLYLAEFTEDDDELLVWSAEDINTTPTAITQQDGLYAGGHGTHVTGTAAGGGRLNPDFTGIAPETDIIFVKGIRDADSMGGFEDGDVIEGIAFIFDKADELGRPAVVNLSLGGVYGPLDGSTLYEQFISQLAGPGRIIVAAAGNAGFDYLHAGSNLAPNETVSFLGYAYDDVEFDHTIWADKGAVLSYKITAYFIDDNGSLGEVASTPFLTVGTHNLNTTRGIRLYDSVNAEPAGFVFHDSRNVTDPNNGDTEIYIYIYDGYDGNSFDFAFIDEYYWAITLRATATGGRFDSYVYNGQNLPFNLFIPGSRFIQADRLHSVASPATARNVISVGAYVSTASWSNDAGATFSSAYPSSITWENTYTPVPHEAAYFSSRGPTRDGRMAPVISAPGDIIFSVRPRNIDPEEFEAETLASNNQYFGIQGTSMASPHVAGTVALMLQVNPTLDYAAIMSVLEATSNQDAFTRAQPEHVFGLGKINAHEAVKHVYANFTSIDNDERFAPATVTLMPNYPNPFNPETTIAFDLGTAAAVRLEVYDMLGRRVATLSNGDRYAAGSHRVTFNASTLSSGVYLYRLQVPDLATEVSRTMMLLK
jgi:minor extracellular serine protease Vpr